MQTFAFNNPAEPTERIHGSLYTIAEYEADGGVFDDTGNGGERWDADERKDFIAAMVLRTDDGDEVDDASLAGLQPGEYWYDSVTGYWLIRDWPQMAPLAARMVGGTQR